MKKILILAMLASVVFGLSTEQERKIQIVYKVGKSIQAKDGMTFENGLPSIMGQESSWGHAVIGDRFDKTGRLKSLYDSSLGNLQVKLSTAKLTIKKYPHLKKRYGYMLNTGKSTYKEYAKHKAKLEYYRGIFQSKKWLKKEKAKEKKAISVIKWAKKEFLYHYTFYKKLRAQARQDTMLINALMTNVRFSAEIGGHYLLSMYELAKRKGFSNPYKRAIGRYNGGWNNITYYNKVMSRMVVVKKVMKRIKYLPQI